MASSSAGAGLVALPLFRGERDLGGDVERFHLAADVLTERGTGEHRLTVNPRALAVARHHDGVPATDQDAGNLLVEAYRVGSVEPRVVLLALALAAPAVGPDLLDPRPFW